jgi:hypothetical protein
MVLFFSVSTLKLKVRALQYAKPAVYFLACRVNVIVGLAMKNSAD